MKHDLCLRVVQQYGVHTARDATVTFIEDGLLDAARFRDVLPEAEFSCLVYAQCSVRWQSLGPAAAWWLQHGSRTWACAVNDVPLACGQAVMLHVGDHIELGMLRLEVAGPPGMGTVSASIAQVGQIELNRQCRSSAIADQSTPADNADTPPFALVDLADSDGCAQWNGNADPFDIIRALELPAHGLPITADAFDEVAPGHAGSQRSAMRADDVMNQLAKEYIRTIVDPASLHAQRMAEIHAAVVVSTVETPEQLAAKTKEHDTLEDIVSGRLEMDQVLLHFGTEEVFLGLPGTSQDDVLHFFAGDILPASRRARPPALTRREHHAISPDSHYSLAVSDNRGNSDGEKSCNE
ncbi:TagK domain-containing protein [Collimonas silvisoli]|uniref:TagK domain-containing protein n=1 Tax=Collimonas silvisoli TaxID=2825884 RepID=UPI001B8C89C2|nr:TagK domain-containing protein [Collimonas silvisoli]